MALIWWSKRFRNRVILREQMGKRKRKENTFS